MHLVDKLEPGNVVIVERNDLDLVAQRQRGCDRVLAAGERQQCLVAVGFLVGGDQIVATEVTDGVETGYVIPLSRIAYNGRGAACS
jgi:hypothetical protein